MPLATAIWLLNLVLNLVRLSYACDMIAKMGSVSAQKVWIFHICTGTLVRPYQVQVGYGTCTSQEKSCHVRIYRESSLGQSTTKCIFEQIFCRKKQVLRSILYENLPFWTTGRYCCNWVTLAYRLIPIYIHNFRMKDRRSFTLVMMWMSLNLQ